MGIEQRFTVEQQSARAKAENWAYRGDMSTEDEVLQLIASLIRVSKPEVVVETGTYHGHGTQMIAHALDMNEKGHLWTVEQDEVFFPYREHPRVTYVQADSLEWAEHPMAGQDRWGEDALIDFAFVDCGEPEHRTQVFSALLPHMNDDGLIVVHDTWFYESEFLRGLCDKFGAPPAIHFPALNGVSVWRT